MKKPEFPKPRIIRESFLPEQDTTETKYRNLMIDLSQLTEDQINELELQIQKHKEEQKHKDNLKNLKGYKVTFYVRFDPEKHKDDDTLTDGGALDIGIFADYLCDTIAPQLTVDFDFGAYEGVSYPIVRVATQQDIENQF